MLSLLCLVSSNLLSSALFPLPPPPLPYTPHIILPFLPAPKLHVSHDQDMITAEPDTWHRNAYIPDFIFLGDRTCAQRPQQLARVPHVVQNSLESASIIREGRLRSSDGRVGGSKPKTVTELVNVLGQHPLPFPPVDHVVQVDVRVARVHDAGRQQVVHGVLGG